MLECSAVIASRKFYNYKPTFARIRNFLSLFFQFIQGSIIHGSIHYFKSVISSGKKIFVFSICQKPHIQVFVVVDGTSQPTPVVCKFSNVTQNLRFSATWTP